jgi:threonine dehydrogenase-like Zn-dependent dehydrogenase
MKAIQYRRSVPRYLLVRAFAGHWPGIATGRLGVVGLHEIPLPGLLTDRWVRIRTRLCGICGSDLATILAQGSPYFSALTSFPFVLGHEIVGVIDKVGPAVTDFAPGERVTIEPVLGCAVREIAPPCAQCRAGNTGNCEHTTHGPLASGIQTGFCRDTGGGFSPFFLAHASQVRRLPDALSDEAAVLIEPFSCALHAALKPDLPDSATALVLGVGTMGLLTIAALRAAGRRARVIAVAKYPHQAALAESLGADLVVRASRDTYAEICRATGAELHRPALGKPVLGGGADVTFDCIGSAGTIDDALRFTRAHGTVVLVGMPAVPKGVDWTSIWYKELEVVGAYTQGTEVVGGQSVRTFELAMRLMLERGAALEPLVNARFPLGDFRRAIAHALASGRRGAVKTVFEFGT